MTSSYLELMDPELEFIPYEVHLEGGNPYRGHAGVRQWWEDLFAVLPDVKAEVFEIRDFGTRTVVSNPRAGTAVCIPARYWLRDVRGERRAHPARV